MSIRRGVPFAVLSFLLPIIATASMESTGGPRRPADLSWFWDALRSAESVDVLEGLPHPVFERDSFAREVGHADTIELTRERFYSEPLSVPPELIERIQTRMMGRALYATPWEGAPPLAKFCGGFHADYGVRWNLKASRYAAILICFGCREIRFTSPSVSYTTDLTAEGFTFLRSTLSPLKKNRPAWNDRETSLKQQFLPPSEKPVTDVTLPNDVAEKAVRELAAHPVSEVEFWWLNELVPQKRSRKR